MNILVTGGLGFIGSHVVRKLKEQAHTVRVIDSLEPRIHGGEPGRGKHVGDVGYTDLYDLDVVVHLAAQVGVADSQVDWFRYLRENTMETAQFLSALTSQTRKPAKLVVASSMSVYGDPGTADAVREDHAIRPASIYGLTKFDQERLALIWGEQHGVSTTALRFFNVYGPGQALHNPYTGVLANFANWLLRDEQPTVFEDGQQTRDFVYVEDVADCVVQQALSDGASGVYNICTGVPTTIEQTAVLLAQALNKDIPPRITGTRRSGDIRHCIGNPGRYRATFYGGPSTPFAEGIKRYAEALRAS